MREVWKDIPGFEGKYQVSNLGRVKSLARIRWKRGFAYQYPERILKPIYNPNGYAKVSLHYEGRATQVSIHRLVADVFIPNPEEKAQVNHKNGDRADNRAENLEWMTPLENTRHSIYVLGHPKKGMNGHAVRCIETGEVYASASLAEHATGASHSGLLNCLKNPQYTDRSGVQKRRTAGGYHWEYVEKDN